MPTLHGSWINKLDESFLFIWGETWRSNYPDRALNKSVNLHLFLLNKLELIDLLKSKNLEFSPKIEETWTSQIINLPSTTIQSKNIDVPYLSSQLESSDFNISKNSLFLKNWKIQGFCLKDIEIINFFRQLPLGFSDNHENYLGEDLKFWSHIYRWSLDLLTRGKFLPGLTSLKEKNPQSQWYLILDSTIDQTRLSKFSKLMPIGCLAYLKGTESEVDIKTNFLESQQLILDFLRNIINIYIRSFSQSSSLLNQDLLIQRWLKSLTEIDPSFTAYQNTLKRLENALYNWSLSIQEYLVTSTNITLGVNQFRVCFYLESPNSKAINLADTYWNLKYYLQALDDKEILVDSQTIWENPVEQLSWGERTIEKPQETLLKGLGLASRLYSPIAESLQESQPLCCKLNPIQVYEFIKSSATILEDNGLGVILPSSLAREKEETRLGISIEAEVKSKKDERLSLQSLLNYKLQLVIGRQIISQKEFERLLYQKSPLVEINGEWITLQPSDIQAVKTVFNDSCNQLKFSVEDALRLSIGDNKMIAKLPVINFKTSGVLQKLINNFTNNQSIEIINNPPGFEGELRPYQKRGVSWLVFLEQWGLGACLADDMGLGKTPQLLAFLLHLKAQEMLREPVLLVCPTSVLNNWEREVKKFSPTLSTLIHHGEKRKKGKSFTKIVKSKHLVITSYPLVYRDTEILEQVEWKGLVLDEAQNIKNPQAKQSQAVRRLKTEFRVALTGTPVENRLSELWSILDFLNPGFLGNQRFFQRRFAEPIEKYGDRESVQILRSLVRPFILRRLKSDQNIIQDLPEKQEINVFCGLSPEQGRLYQELVDNSLYELESKTGIQRQGIIFSLLIKLKQICNHPAQFLKEKQLRIPERSGKLMRLEAMLEELIEEDDRALIFTQFSEWGKLLQSYLQKRFSQDVLFLYGATRREKRQEMIDRFQNDPNGPAIFILSLKAGGTGLNLTRANHVFHVDRWWNPAVENQATDRAFRIGQKRNVQIHKFICTGTLEEKINDLLENKKQLAEQTVDAGENWLTKLDTEQLRTLLLLDRKAIIDEE
ncbi:Non-specific serine/threonine protein kinase [cyanobacterium endosymbiont of Rhopalodia gibberula]|uniref:DEAD/DEAH box helicase n=1 Tax=cyanobacterium endosymbiont of Rhopalodia gibberula TaxID=1763363 RepID=UPI000DC6D30F|nr:DEAD/DEAH box helicase [cyanobacterium endosymbiont of Rhopalodia gibberula]BBA78765.1 Non-specific serine/threonine protein kinase [cyanobacterium endosymbiont of Rhopalodia gibberula]